MLECNQCNWKLDEKDHPTPEIEKMALQHLNAHNTTNLLQQNFTVRK